jgi:hypothetical protein
MFKKTLALAGLLGCALLVQAASMSGGRSVGVSRPAVVRSVPTYRPAPVAAAPRPALTTPAAPVAPATHNTTIIHQNGGGGGGGFGSSFLGGAAGAVVGNALMQPHTPVVVQQPAVVAAPAAVAAQPQMIDPSPVAQAPVYVAPARDTSNTALTLFTWFLVLTGIAVIGYWLFVWLDNYLLQRKRNKMLNEPLGFDPIVFFLNTQAAFFGRKKAELRQLLGPNLYTMMVSGMPSVVSRHVFMVNFDVISRYPDEVSIRYRGEDTTDGEPVDEVWHFVKVNGVWVVDGIEQLGEN